jgi:uncharacterized pyridoxal phosphate-containing UPF0001 family protein
MSIQDNLEHIRSQMAAACARSGRDPAAVRLVAVSKTHPAILVEEAAAAGQRLFGESYVQEFVAKIVAVQAPVEWHFLGARRRWSIAWFERDVSSIAQFHSLTLAATTGSQWLRA